MKKGNADDDANADTVSREFDQEECKSYRMLAARLSGIAQDHLARNTGTC